MSRICTRPSSEELHGGLIFSVLAARQSERLELEAARAAFVDSLAPAAPATAAPLSPSPRSRAPSAARAKPLAPPPPAVCAFVERGAALARPTPPDLVLALVVGWQADSIDAASGERSRLLGVHGGAFRELLRTCAFRSVNADVEADADAGICATVDADAIADDDAAPAASHRFACPAEICIGRRVLSPPGARSLAALLALSADVRVLDVADVQLAPEGACLLVRALRFAPALRTLSLAGNVLGGAPGSTSAAVTAALAAELRRPRGALTALDLSHSRLGDAGARALARALARGGGVGTDEKEKENKSRMNTSLRRLCLRASGLGDVGAHEFASCLAPVERGGAGAQHRPLALEELDLSHNSIGPAGATALVALLGALERARGAHAALGGGAARLRALTLTRNKLTMDAASLLARAASGVRPLAGAPGCAGMLASPLARAASGVRPLAGAPGGAGMLASPPLSSCPSAATAVTRRGRGARRPDSPTPSPPSGTAPRVPALGGTPWSDATATAPALALSCVRDADAQLLAHDLRTDARLRSLRLSASRLSDSAALVLALALRTNHALRELDLMGNALANAAAAALGEALRGGRNTTLAILGLRNNSIADDGAAALADALADNRSLRCLSLARNRLTDACAQSVVALLNANTALRALQLGGNLVGAVPRLAIRAAWDRHAERAAGGVLDLS
ncbi:hypothetical protein KFE25_013104 [Diacronema lutheri]|uniref:Uncharacterized protein n=1 Tax=Diacronema lutheri TaxID=2081491 RepID=A0A8J5XAF4_DIALT|nr:hypothetical protein KFE25_013104 [Diacronema lutheri]